MPQSMNRAYNFNAGPAALPLSVLLQAQEELVDFQNSGMSLMELSHRGALYEDIHNEAIALLKELLQIPAGYEVLFLQGGASLQFSMVPFNFLQAGRPGGYVLTGSWSEKALAEGELIGDVYEAASSKADHYRRIPTLDELKYRPDSSYVHITSNNTIFGTQWSRFPNTGDVPLFADMSSDILSKSIDVSKFALIYAGAQKNLGPSGVTVVILRSDLLERAPKNIPTMLRYETHAKTNSLYNTPPTYGIYMLNLVLKWVKELGGVTVLEQMNRDKAALIYDAIDASNGFYSGHADKDSRSQMNITFRLQSEELEKKFLTAAIEAGFVGLNGHRSVGGCRASGYNAVSMESCVALRKFMIQFQKDNQ